MANDALLNAKKVNNYHYTICSVVVDRSSILLAVIF